VTHKRIAVVVEDFPPLSEQMRTYLQAREFVVHAASDHASAVRILEQCVPHLVCLDLTLPHQSGFELCEHIRSQQRFAATSILVTSERASPEDMAMAEEVGANAYLKKPFTRERFLKYVTALLDGPFASRASVRRLCRSDPPPA